MKTKKSLSLLIIFLSLFLLAFPTSAATRTIRLEQGRKATKYVFKGDKLIILAEPYLTWSSSKPYVAKVTQTGTVKVLRKGRTVIKAKKAGTWYACCIVVETPSIDPESITMDPGDKRSLEVVGTKQKVRWKSSDKKVAAVDKDGKVTAKKEGTATVTAYVSDRAFSCMVTVNPALVTSPPPAVLTPRTEFETQPEEDKPDHPLPAGYVLNTRTMEVHLPGCRYLDAIDPDDKKDSEDSYGHIRLDGYMPCRSCMKDVERFP